MPRSFLLAGALLVAAASAVPATVTTDYYPASSNCSAGTPISTTYTIGVCHKTGAGLNHANFPASMLYAGDCKKVVLTLYKASEDCTGTAASTETIDGGAKTGICIPAGATSSLTICSPASALAPTAWIALLVAAMAWK